MTKFKFQIKFKTQIPKIFWSFDVDIDLTFGILTFVIFRILNVEALDEEGVFFDEVAALFHFIAH